MEEVLRKFLSCKVAVQIYEDEDFGDSSLILHGPVQYANIRGLLGADDKDWGDQIDSIITGSKLLGCL